MTKDMVIKDKEFLTVSELNILIQDVLNMGFPQGVWVCGEIQGFDRNRSKKHVFFELCEKDRQTHDVLARIGLVIFAQRKHFIEQLLKSAENAFELKDDIEVKFFCRVDFYPPHGAVRLIVESVDPVYTLGKIAQQKQKLIAVLKNKGILDKNKTRALPLVPLRVGLITAFDSAAYNDFLNELALSGLSFRVLFKNALMQGKGAEQDVCRALAHLGRVKGLDVIVITRGGGSLADLSCFDSEKIAEGIAACPLPVLSGIGHEINITITDLAAHTYQKTPTAVARFLVEKVNDFLFQIDDKGRQILGGTQTRIGEAKKSVKQFAYDVYYHARSYLKARRKEHARFLDILKRRPAKLLETHTSGLARKERDFLRTVKVFTRQLRLKMDNYEKLVVMADPRQTLKRGFSITRTGDGRVLRSVRDVRQGDRVETQCADGFMDSDVLRVKGHKNF